MVFHIFRSRETRLRQQCREWFLAHRHRLLAYARQQADSMTDVELLLSETCRSVAQVFCRGGLPEPELLPYALRSIYHAAARQRARNRRRVDTEQAYARAEEPLRPVPGAELDSGLEDVHVTLRALLRRLPPELAEVLTLRIWEELSFAEIGRRLGLPESTVRARHAGALQKMRTMLAEHNHAG